MFGPADVADPDAAFLRDYIQNTRWREEEAEEEGLQRYIDQVVGGENEGADVAGERADTKAVSSLDEDEEFVE